MTLTITYDESALPPSVKESTLQLYRFDARIGNWAPLPIEERLPEANQITRVLDYLSEFALMASENNEDNKEFIYLPMIIR